MIKCSVILTITSNHFQMLYRSTLITNVHITENNHTKSNTVEICFH